MTRKISKSFLVVLMAVIGIVSVWVWSQSEAVVRYGAPRIGSTPPLAQTSPEVKIESGGEIDGWSDAIEAIDSPAFAVYVRDYLSKRCLFYVPDGAGYRNCLWEVVDATQAAYSKTDPTVEQIIDECQLIASQLDGVVAGEVVLSCEAYKFSLK